MSEPPLSAPDFEVMGAALATVPFEPVLTRGLALPVDDLTRPRDLDGLANGQLALPPLVQFPLPGRPLAKAHRIAARAFRALFAEVKDRFGVELTSTSTPDCYRSYEVQRSTFLSRYVTYNTGRGSKWWQGRQYWLLPGMAIAATPGTSNHGWGLAVDVAIARPLPTGGYDSPAPIGSRGDVLNWLLGNAARYGMSWEAQSEPWHIRYNAGDHIPQAVLDYEHPIPLPPTPPPPPIERTVLNITKTTLRPELRDQLRGNGDVVLLQAIALGLFRVSGNADLDVGSTDGDYGPRTQGAARVLQALSHVPVDAVVGPVSWTAILNADGR